MNEHRTRTAVAIAAFNRPEPTQKVFEAIRAAAPRKLFVILDAPKPGRQDDIGRCARVRDIVESVDWDCAVHRSYADANMGCGRRMATGVSWVFENVEEAIILEDDCLPDHSFFRFCDEMLERYRDDERMMYITGTNLLGQWKSSIASYHFSIHGGGIWGWASWRRAWRHFDFDISLWEDEELKVLLRDHLRIKTEYLSKTLAYDRCVRDSDAVNAWDYQWGLARLVQSGLAIVPCVNLIHNMGFGSDATHTRAPGSYYGRIPLGSMEFPLRHRNFVLADWEYDRRISRLPYSGVRRLISVLALRVRYMLHKLGVSRAK